MFLFIRLSTRLAPLTASRFTQIKNAPEAHRGVLFSHFFLFFAATTAAADAATNAAAEAIMTAVFHAVPPFFQVWQYTCTVRVMSLQTLVTALK